MEDVFQRVEKCKLQFFSFSFAKKIQEANMLFFLNFRKEPSSFTRTQLDSNESERTNSKPIYGNSAMYDDLIKKRKNKRERKRKNKYGNGGWFLIFFF